MPKNILMKTAFYVPLYWVLLYIASQIDKIEWAFVLGSVAGVGMVMIVQFVDAQDKS